MQTITIINWSLLVVYGIGLTYSALTLNTSGTDAAGRGMAAGYLFIGFIGLALLIGVNCFPFQLTRVVVFVLLLIPATIGVFHLVGQLFTAKGTEHTNARRFDGSYYFQDRQRKELAKVSAAHDIVMFEALLQKPIPQLNESGKEHITLLDLVTMRGVYSASSQLDMPFLTRLLEKGATIETDDILHSPTHALVSRDCSVALMEWFLKNGADPNAKRLQNQPIPILFMVMDYHYDRLAKVRLLLDYGADPNSVYPPAASGWLAGHSALLAAARQELWDVCELLLEKGADATVKGPQQQLFTELLMRRAERDDVPATFTSLLTRLSWPTGQQNEKRHD